MDSLLRDIKSTREALNSENSQLDAQLKVIKA
jgi:hypothetical protein